MKHPCVDRFKNYKIFFMEMTHHPFIVRYPGKRHKLIGQIYRATKNGLDVEEYLLELSKMDLTYDELQKLLK
jgi:hypothetical protein